MAKRPLRPCRVVGCPNLTRQGYCDEHAYLAKKRSEQGRPSSARRGYGYEWRKTRQVFLEENPYCEVCGAPATEVHHIVPLRRGGEVEGWENLRALCKTHHSQITAKELNRKKSNIP